MICASLPFYFIVICATKMRLLFTYLLFFLFLIGFSFTGKDNSPRFLRHAQHSEQAMKYTDSNKLQSTVEQVTFEQLLYVNDTDSNEDVNSLSQQLQRLLHNDLAVYYFSLIKIKDPAPVSYAGFVHEEMPIPAVPKFIRHHQLLIPFRA